MLIFPRSLEFMEMGNFETFIVGHSCGLSDKTMLKTIFEHETCVAIKNFNYRGKDEDFDKRMQIARHFSDKPLMRKKVLPFDDSAVIPQKPKS